MGARIQKLEGRGEAKEKRIKAAKQKKRCYLTEQSWEVVENNGSEVGQKGKTNPEQTQECGKQSWDFGK